MSLSTRFPDQLSITHMHPGVRRQPQPLAQRSASDVALPAAITRAASKQTYVTIRLLADPDRTLDALRAYAYFRWVDDCVDGERMPLEYRVRFVQRQQALLDHAYAGLVTRFEATAEERLLIDLIANHHEADSGLRAYLYNMMSVMAFDVERRGRLISNDELTRYSDDLAKAVTEALHHFIGHCQPTPPTENRCRAVTGAHITHLLRDSFEDVEAGYFNISREFVEAHGIAPGDIHSDAYRAWVKSRVKLARAHFAAGRVELARVRNWRCRLAGAAYIARFETVLDAIERDGYHLRREYNERKTPRGVLKIFGSTLRTCLGWVR